MKLRLRDNTLRLRLTQDEVAAVGRGEAVETAVPFPGGRRLVYAVMPADVAAPEAGFDGGRVVVRLPGDEARSWADSDRVGFEGRQPVGEGQVLELTVEKDFECLHRDGGAEDAGTFPHPAAEDASP